MCIGRDQRWESGDTEVAARLEEHLARVVAADGAPVAVVAVVIDGRITVARHGDRPPSDHTTFELGSVTKTFTALLLAELVRTGEVGLDDPISAHLPAHAVPADPIAAAVTLGQLATHSGGLPPLPANLAISTDPQWLLNPYADYLLEDLYRTTANLALESAPGTRVAYSNLGIGLLGQLLVNATGRDYPELVRGRVCDPLGLGDTAAYPGPHEVSGHKQGRPTPPFEMGALAGSGVLRSSPGDLTRYLRALLDPDGFALSEALRAVQTPRLPVRERHSIALVWNHRRFRFGDVLFHGGETVGSAAFVGFCPSARLGLFALSNSALTEDSVFIQHTYDLLKNLAKERIGATRLGWERNEVSNVDLTACFHHSGS
jgi:serine-type D-Ala-D-Ala carboxypeptidase/endopeptidase